MDVMMISIKKLGENAYQVTVESDRTTRHEVTVRPGDYHRLTGGGKPVEELIRKSFEFLLEREPNTSILDQFDLMVIQRYFPEYEREIKTRLG